MYLKKLNSVICHEHDLINVGPVKSKYCGTFTLKCKKTKSQI